MSADPQLRPGPEAVVDFPQSDRVDAVYRDPLAIGLGCASLALYLIAMPKTVALEDDSVFILSGYFNGVSHPPGYPLYTLLLHLFSQIPIGEIPARAHASSALFAALACVLLFRIFCRVGLERPLAALGTAAFAVSNTFWSQSIIAEVYSLNLLLNLGLFLFALNIDRAYNLGAQDATARPRDFALFSLFLGLALANHWPLTVLALPGYLLLVARPFVALRNKLAAVLPAAVSIGLAYGYLYFNNQSSPFINFSGRFSGIGEFIDFVMRSHYGIVDHSDTSGLRDKAGFALDLLRQFAKELNILLPFSAYGLYRMLASRSLRLPGLALLWLVLANGFLLVALINFDYGELYSVVFQVYPIVSIAMLFVLAGCGTSLLLADHGFGVKPYQFSLLLLLCLLANLFFSLPQNFRHQYAWGAAYAERILEEVPPGAILFSDGDVELGLLAYYRFVGGRRPDLKLYSSSALLLDNRLFDYRLDDKKAFLDRFVQERPQVPIYAANNYYNLDRVAATLFTERLGRPDGEPPQSITGDDIELILKWSAAPDMSDPWTRLAVEILRQKAISILTSSLKNTTDKNLEQFIVDSIDRLIQSDEDALHFLVTLSANEDEITPAYFRGQLAAIDRAGLSSKQMDSHYRYLEELAGQARLTEAWRKQARDRACLNWPSRKNTYCLTANGG